MWELDPARWTHSRLICAAGLRAMSAAAGMDRRTGIALADSLVAEATAWGLHPSGRWQRAAGDERVDAALLTAGIRGAVPPGDPRTRATIDAVDRELAEDGYAYRYRIDDRPLGESEGAFLVCGLWMALAWHQQGEPVRRDAMVRAEPGRVRRARGSTPRSTTSPSASCAGTCRRRSCTRSSWSARRPWARRAGR